MKKKVKIKKVDEYYCAILIHESGKRPASNIPGYEVESEVVGHTNPAFTSVPRISEQFIKEYVAAGEGCEVEMEMQEWNTVVNSEINQKYLKKEGWTHIKSELPEPPFNDAEIHYYERPKKDSEGNLVLSVVKKKIYDPATGNMVGWDVVKPLKLNENGLRILKALQDRKQEIKGKIDEKVNTGVSALTKAIDTLGKEAVTAILADIPDMPGPKIYPDEQTIQKQIDQIANEYIKELPDTEDGIYSENDVADAVLFGINWARKNL